MNLVQEAFIKNDMNKGFMTGAAFHHPLLMLPLKRTMHALVGSKVVAAVRHVPIMLFTTWWTTSPPHISCK